MRKVRVLQGSGIGPIISEEEGRARLDAYAGGCKVGREAAKRDIQFLLRQLHLMEHMMDREGIAVVAKRNGIAYPTDDLYSAPTTLEEFEQYSVTKRKRP
jgi:hypothetical protein